MSLVFPESPALDDEYGRWFWDGEKWKLIPVVPDCPETLWRKTATTELTVPDLPTISVTTDVDEDP